MFVTEGRTNRTAERGMTTWTREETELDVQKNSMVDD